MSISFKLDYENFAEVSVSQYGTDVISFIQQDLPISKAKDLLNEMARTSISVFQRIFFW